jgi:methylmalonyl-CoA/ethylmalonyl-CoA epimerase
VITGVSFVGVAVKDIEEAQRQYADVFGLQPWDQGVLEMPGVKAVMLPLSNCSIELLQPTVGPEAPAGGDLARWLDKRGEGFCRLGLWVDSMDEEIKRLKENGMQVLESGEYGEVGEEMGARMALVHPRSTRGVLIELDQQI